jgi:predicted AAA+ superfamily ATPase
MGDLSKARSAFDSLTVYRNLLNDETVSRFLRLLAAAEGGDAASFCAAYGEFFYSLANRNTALELARLLERLVRLDDNAFSRAAVGGEEGKAYDLLRKAAEHDLAAIASLAAVSAGQIKTEAGGAQNEAIAALPEYAADSKNVFARFDLYDLICEMEVFYQRNGFGRFAEFGAFRWSGELVGVANADPVRLNDLKEYNYERGLVVANTLDFLEGRGGGNLLLYGDRGTGKSSTVKALANEYRAKGLRIVELPLKRLPELPAVIETLRAIPLKFLLFLDDVSFATDDESFSSLKSVLEGGVVARPENCRVYATSNRRHLIKESFSDRNADDVHAGDTMQEKLSLADRFDQTISFFAPDQAHYFAIVRSLAADRGLNLPAETLERAAVQWALRSGGRTPRAARQFVDWAQAQFEQGRPLLESESD